MKSVTDNEIMQYDKHRTALLRISDQALNEVRQLAEDRILGKYMSRYAAVETRKLEYSNNVLQHDILTVALLGQSQVGKTTTMTAVTDGRELSPCGRGGGGMRTSAIPITVYHDAKESRIEISLYTKEELADMVVESVGAFLRMERPADSEEVDMSPANGVGYDLDNPEDYRKLRRAVEMEIELYRKGDDYRNDRLDLLHQAILILAFYGGEGYRQLQAGAFNTIQKIRKFLAFSNSVEQRWALLREQGFGVINSVDENGQRWFDEVENLHVFVRDIMISVQSSFMDKTKTAIIDPPGTMMSVEDTKRALKAAHDAAIVLYIVPCDKQLTQADKDMLRLLKNSGLSDKVVFALNIRRPIKEICNNGIDKSILASIKAAGYEEKHHKELLYYNAFLAERAAQGWLLMNGEADEMTVRAILDDVEVRGKDFGGDVEKAWIYTTRQGLRNLEMDDEADKLKNQGICEENLKMINRISRWEELINELRRHVMANRQASLLRDLGAQPVRDAVAYLESGLRQTEENVNRTVQEIDTAHKEAKALLDTFSQRIDDALVRNLTHDLDEALAADYFNKVVMKAVEPAAARAAMRIYEEDSLGENAKRAGIYLLNTGKDIVNKVGQLLTGSNRDLLEKEEIESAKERGNRILRECYDLEMTALATKWSNDLIQSTVYDQQVTMSIERVKAAYLTIWDELQLDQNKLMMDVPPMPVDLTGNISRDVIKFSQLYDDLQSESNIDPITQAVMTSVGMGFARSILLFLMPVNTILTGSYILEGAIWLLRKVVEALDKDQQEKQIETIADNICNEMVLLITKDRESIISHIAKGDKTYGRPQKGMSVVRCFYENAFRFMVVEQHKELDKKYQAEQQLLDHSKVEREAIVQRAKELRMKIFQPLIAQLDEELVQIQKIWG